MVELSSALGRARCFQHLSRVKSEIVVSWEGRKRLLEPVQNEVNLTGWEHVDAVCHNQASADADLEEGSRGSFNGPVMCVGNHGLALSLHSRPVNISSALQAVLGESLEVCVTDN